MRTGILLACAGLCACADASIPYGCQAHSDCAVNDRCVDGTCLPTRMPGSVDSNPFIADTSTKTSTSAMDSTPIPLNGICERDADCASHVCFDVGRSKRCVSACGATSDCPVGFTCHPFDGARLCVEGSIFQSDPPFSTDSGESCISSGACRSGLCLGGTCRERCSEEADCSELGGPCAWFEASSDRWDQACGISVGAASDGEVCSIDTECASGVCFQGRCARPCSSSSDCDSDHVCSVRDYSTGGWVQALTICIAEPVVGVGPIGSRCARDEDCRSLLCDRDTSLCTDTCGSDVDCPADLACKPEVLAQLAGGQTLRFNICQPQ